MLFLNTNKTKYLTTEKIELCLPLLVKLILAPSMEETSRLAKCTL